MHTLRCRSSARSAPSLTAVICLQSADRQQITDSNGNVVEKTETEVIRQVISEETSAEMRDILEGVVEEGLGSPAAVEGYRVGGKTGTAEIAQGGTYSDGNYILSFMGLRAC